MRHGNYVGPDRNLRGRGAAIRKLANGDVLAQFDDRGLRGANGAFLAFCWTRFAADDFRLDDPFGDIAAPTLGERGFGT